MGATVRLVRYARYQSTNYYLRMHADTHRVEGLADEHAAFAVEVFRMLADLTRVRLLWALLDQELSVGELAAVVGKPAAGVSQHLAKLRMARLVRTRREGTTVYYRIENSHIRQLIQDAVYHADHASGGVPEHHRADSVVGTPVQGNRDSETGGT